MFKKLTLAIAAGTGYVLGAKAGQQRYQQIESKFREFAGMPAVQNATSTVKEQAAPLLDSAKSTVSDKVSSATDKPSSSTPPPPPVTGTGAATTTRSTAAAGAAPSATTPPVPPVTSTTTPGVTTRP